MRTGEKRSEVFPARMLAAGTAVLLGAGALTLSGCAGVKPKYTGCITTHVNVDGASAIRDSIVHSLDQAMIQDTGSGLPEGNSYSGASKTADKIQEKFVEQYAAGGQIIDTDQYALAETNPFKHAMIRYCVGQKEKIDGTLIPDSPGTIQIGNLACNMTFEVYATNVRDEVSREFIKERCGGELALPEDLR